MPNVATPNKALVKLNKPASARDKSLNHSNVTARKTAVFFSPFSIAITSLGEERANLSAFRTFVRFVLV